LSVIVLEKGSLVDYIRRFPRELVWFSTPEQLEIGGVPFVVPTVRPTRVDTLNYYRAVARQYALDIRYFDPVVSLVRTEGTFVITTKGGAAVEGKNAVVATGYFDHPNRLDIPGESRPNVFHYYDEPFEYSDADVVVVGGRNSAVEAALDLYRHGARVTLVHRGDKLSEGVKYWILPDIQNRLKAGEIDGIFNARATEIRERTVLLDTAAGVREVKSDFTFVLIGFHPDTGTLRSFGIEVIPDTLAPKYDERTFETNVPGLYVAGSVVAGKNNNKVFVENGRGHGAVIVAAILDRRRGPHS